MERQYVLIAVLSSIAAFSIIILTFPPALDINLLNPNAIAAIIIFQVASWTLSSVRTRIVAENERIKLSLAESFKINMIYMFYVLLTPSSIGGEPVKIKLLKNLCKSYGKASAVVCIEKYCDFTALLSIALALLIITKDVMLLTPIAFLSVALALLLLSIHVPQLLLKRIKRKRIRDIVEDFSRAKDIFFSTPLSCFLKSFLLSITSTVLNFLTLSLVLIALGYAPYILLCIEAQLILYVFGFLFITPGGSGFTELGIAYFLLSALPKNVVGVAVALWRVLTYFFTLLIGMVINVRYLTKSSKVAVSR